MSTLRRLSRNVAKVNMKKEGMRQICKGRPSFFSLRWREYAKGKK